MQSCVLRFGLKPLEQLRKSLSHIGSSAIFRHHLYYSVFKGCNTQWTALTIGFRNVNTAYWFWFKLLRTQFGLQLTDKFVFRRI